MSRNIYYVKSCALHNAAPCGLLAEKGTLTPPRGRGIPRGVPLKIFLILEET